MATPEYGQDSLCHPGSFHKSGASWFSRYFSALNTVANANIVDEPDATISQKALRLTEDTGAAGSNANFGSPPQSGFGSGTRYDEFDLYMDLAAYASYYRFLQYACDDGKGGSTTVRIELHSHTSDTAPKIVFRVAADASRSSGTALASTDFPLQDWNRLRLEYTVSSDPGTASDGTITLYRWDGSEWDTLLTATHNLGDITDIDHLAVKVSSGIDHNNYRRKWVWLVGDPADHGLDEADATWWRDYLHQLRPGWAVSNQKVKYRVACGYDWGLYGYDDAAKPIWGVQIATDSAFTDLVFDGYTDDPQTVDSDNQYWVNQTTDELDPETTYYIRGVIRPTTGDDPIYGFETTFQTVSTRSSAGLESLRVFEGTCNANWPADGMVAVRRRIEAGAVAHLCIYPDDLTYIDTKSIFAAASVTAEQWGYYADAALLDSDFARIAASVPVMLGTGDHPFGPFDQAGWSGGGGVVGIIADEAGDVAVGNTVNLIDFYNSVWRHRLHGGYPDQAALGPRPTAASLNASWLRDDGTTPIADHEIAFYSATTKQVEFIWSDARRWHDYEQGAEGATGEMPFFGSEQLGWLEDRLGDTARNLKVLATGLVITPRFCNSWLLTGTPSGTFTVGETVTQATSAATGTVIGVGASWIVVGKENGGGTFVTTNTVTGGSSGATIAPTAVTESNKPNTEGFGRTDGDTGLWTGWTTANRIHSQEYTRLKNALHSSATGVIFSADDHWHMVLKDIFGGGTGWEREICATFKSGSHGVAGAYNDFDAMAADLAFENDGESSVAYLSNNGGASSATGYAELVINERTGTTDLSMFEVDGLTATERYSDTALSFTPKVFWTPRNKLRAVRGGNSPRPLRI